MLVHKYILALGGVQLGALFLALMTRSHSILIALMMFTAMMSMYFVFQLIEQGETNRLWAKRYKKLKRKYLGLTNIIKEYGEEYSFETNTPEVGLSGMIDMCEDNHFTMNALNRGSSFPIVILDDNECVVWFSDSLAKLMPRLKKGQQWKLDGVLVNREGNRKVALVDFVTAKGEEIQYIQESKAFKLSDNSKYRTLFFYRSEKMKEVFGDEKIFHYEEFGDVLDSTLEELSRLIEVNSLNITFKDNIEAVWRYHSHEMKVALKETLSLLFRQIGRLRDTNVMLSYEETRGGLKLNLTFSGLDYQLCDGMYLPKNVDDFTEVAKSLSYLEKEYKSDIRLFRLNETKSMIKVSINDQEKTQTVLHQPRL